MTQSVDLGAIANIPRGQFRARVDEGIKAVVTMNSGAGEPPLLYPFLPWASIADNSIYIRNASNTAWVRNGRLAPFAWASADFVINVRQFGAAGGGTADDTAAITTAIAAMPAAGGRLYFPAGIYRVSSAITLNKSGTYFGDGAATIIRTTSATADTFDVAAGAVVIEDMAFDAAVTRTAGSFVRIMVSDVRLQRFRMTGAAIGITVDPAIVIITIADGLILNCVPATGVGVLWQGGFALYMRGICIDSAAPIAACVWITGCGDLTIEDCRLRRGNYGLLANPTAGVVVASLWVSNTSCLDAASHGAVLLGNGGSIVRCILDQCTFSGGGWSGLWLAAASGGTVDGIDVFNCGAFANAADGVHLENSGVHNTRIVGGAFAGNGLSGIAAQPGVTDFAVIGVRSGATHGLPGNGYGVFIAGSTSNYTVANSNLLGNSVANLMDGGAGPKDIAGNLS